MKMDLSELIVIFAMLWRISSGSEERASLSCYSCQAEAKYSRLDEPICAHFDYSAKYVVECPKSTMCHKKIITTQFGTTIYERGCAPQTLNGYQELKHGKWHPVLKINEVYEEGCGPNPGDDMRVTSTQHCYCRGSLCNTAPVFGVNSGVLVSLITLGILVMR